MSVSTPTDADIIGRIKEKQRVLLKEFQEKPVAGKSAAPGGKKTVTSTPVVKRAASKTPTSVRTSKTYAAAAASTQTATPTSSTSKSPDVVHVEDELELEDLDSFRIPRVPTPEERVNIITE